MYKEPAMIEKIISSLSYLTMGMVGFIWLIVSLFTKAKLKPFTMYHICQSIFIALGFTVLSILIGWISDLLSFIPLINKLVAQITFLLNMPLLFNYSLIQTIIYLFLLYLAVTSFLGRYSYVPWISEIVDQNITH